jgi:hypothetical protein
MKTLSTLEQEARKRAGPRYSWPFGVALLVLGVSLLLFGLPATAQPQLTGRTVTILVGYTAGGGYDRFARIVARHLPRYLPGTPAVVVQNMPGAESVVAANHLFNAARPDGLTIGLFNRNLVFAQLVGVAGVRFDVRRWQWIGNLAEETDVFVIRADLPYRHILEKQWGLQIFTDVQGQPLDSPQFLPVFELAAKRDVPVGCTLRDRQGGRTISRNHVRNTTSGGPWAGRTRRASAWRVWSSLACWTAGPS